MTKYSIFSIGICPHNSDPEFIRIMETWGLDGHPVLQAFRRQLHAVPKRDGVFYYIILSPPYALPRDAHKSPFDYLFMSKADNPTQLISFIDRKKVMEMKNGDLIAMSGFTWSSIRQLMDNQCSSVEGVSFTMIETITDIFHPIPPPDLVNTVMEIYTDGGKASEFLSRKAKNQALKDLMTRIDKKLTTTDDVETNEIDNYVAMMKDMMDEVATTVFAIPEVMDLPVAVKNQMNFLIFNAISAKPHFKLLMAYSQKYHDENAKAQQAMRNRRPVECDTEKMELAIMRLHGILHLPTPADSILCVVKFFDDVVRALPGDDVAADDILPAICMAMAKDLAFASHVMSFFQYLVDIWPSSGVDERTTYILTTCAIAASHLSMGLSPTASLDRVPAIPPVDPEQQKMKEQANATIGMLEDLLGMI